MNKFCSNEADYHQQIINCIDLLPNQLKSEEDLHVFVWGHEIKLLDAGRNGGDGSADLLTVDEKGNVWLIEVKFGYNSELSRFVWENQLKRYKRAIESMSYQRLLRYTKEFLKGRELTKPTDVVSLQAESIVEALAAWQERIGRALVAPDELNRRMAETIGTGTYGIMVLADRFAPDVVDIGQQFEHRGPLAYVQGIPTNAGIEFQLRWHRTASGISDRQSVAIDPDPRFDASEKEVNRWCDPDSFADTLGEGARHLWLNVLQPGLLRLGWDGKPQQVKQMAFNVGFEVKQSLVPLLVIGWSELDAKDVPRHSKLAGQASMKINPRMKQLLKTSGDISLVNRFAERLYQLGWRGRPNRNMNRRWGVVPISAEEVMKAEGVMIYQPDEATRDHNGRPGDKESIEGLLCEFEAVLYELRHR
ncbi:hypothetical protein [Methylococcus capsulatus]|uniref:hypothetical protein n=1 Tax=Methylococcus capsulatus TaxID=414 RepID=UPI0002D6F14D|nr:hypothetical protein [Methylococcus capsulatus]